jgi:hypothetical protein
MNERIKELADQAGLTWNVQPMHFTNTSSPIDFPVSANRELEKFAELIVQECMACSTWVGKMNTNSVEPIHTAHAINKRIMKHFGVEE